jgi:soluble lytic murein transglycosylase-like protein
MYRPTVVAAAFAAAVIGFAVTTAPGTAKDLSGSPFAPTARIAVAKAGKSAEAAKAKQKSAKEKKAGKVTAKVASRKKHAATRAAKTVSTAKAKQWTPPPRLPGIDPVRTASIAAGRAAEAGRYTAIVARYASEYGVPASLAHAVIRVESNYRPNTTGSAGEVGLMQIKPATARMLGYGGSVKGLYDPETNIRYGMKYLAMAQDLGGGTTCGTILKYNAGHAATRMNPVSAAYCRKVKVQLASAGSPA